MLLIDGVRYHIRKPDTEEQFEDMIKEHAKEIFGDDTLYFSIKRKIVSKTGIGSIPDGYLIRFNPLEWYLVEAELSSHSHEHVVMQLNRFMRGIRNFESQREIVDALYDEIKSNPSMRETIRIKSGFEDPHHFLSNTIRQPPKILITIEQEDPDIQEAVADSRVVPEIVVFQTLVKEGADIKTHAHLFEPIFQKGISTPEPSGPSKSSLERGQQYLGFYQELANRLREKVPTAIARPKPLYYCSIPTKLGGSVHFEWLFGGNPRTRLGVELHFERGAKETNIALLKQLEKYKDDIEKATGERVIFQENWTKLCSRLYIEKREGQMTEELKTWAVDKMAALYVFLQPKLEA